MAAPQISPDGRHYWDEQHRQWMPTSSPPPAVLWGVVPRKRLARRTAWLLVGGAGVIAVAITGVAGLTGVLRTIVPAVPTATVTTWAPKSADIAGTVTMGDCYQATVHIDVVDGQGIAIDHLAIPVGNTSNGVTKNWTNHLTAWGGAVDSPIMDKAANLFVTQVVCEQ